MIGLSAMSVSNATWKTSGHGEDSETEPSTVRMLPLPKSKQCFTSIYNSNLSESYHDLCVTNEQSLN